MKALGIGEPKARQAIAALGITSNVFNMDKRTKYYSEQGIDRMRDWLKNHRRTHRSGERPVPWIGTGLYNFRPRLVYAQ